MGRKTSTIQSGRTIGERRERLETANERAAARKKDKQKKSFRVFFTVLGFLLLITAIGVGIYFAFFKDNSEPFSSEATVELSYSPTIEVIDEDASATGGKITSRMSEYIGMVEVDFKSLGYQPIKAVLPSGTIRTIYLYLDGYSGFIKLTADRGSAVSAEDADRLIRYLAAQGTTDFQYLDVRLPGRAYWK